MKSLSQKEISTPQQAAPAASATWYGHTPVNPKQDAIFDALTVELITTLPGEITILQSAPSKGSKVNKPAVWHSKSDPHTIGVQYPQPGLTDKRLRIPLTTVDTVINQLTKIVQDVKFDQLVALLEKNLGKITILQGAPSQNDKISQPAVWRSKSDPGTLELQYQQSSGPDKRISIPLTTVGEAMDQLIKTVQEIKTVQAMKFDQLVARLEKELPEIAIFGDDPLDVILPVIWYSEESPGTIGVRYPQQSGPGKKTDIPLITVDETINQLKDIIQKSTG